MCWLLPQPWLLSLERRPCLVAGILPKPRSSSSRHSPTCCLLALPSSLCFSIPLFWGNSLGASSPDHPSLSSQARRWDALHATFAPFSSLVCFCLTRCEPSIISAIWVFAAVSPAICLLPEQASTNTLSNRRQRYLGRLDHAPGHIRGPAIVGTRRGTSWRRQCSTIPPAAN